jgi:hypothetical protein
MTEEERELVYSMCRLFGVFEVYRNGVLVGVFKFENGKILKIKTKINETTRSNRVGQDF